MQMMQHSASCRHAGFAEITIALPRSASDLLGFFSGLRDDKIGQPNGALGVSSGSGTMRRLGSLNNASTFAAIGLSR